MSSPCVKAGVSGLCEHGRAQEPVCHSICARVNLPGCLRMQANPYVCMAVCVLQHLLLPSPGAPGRAKASQSAFHKPPSLQGHEEGLYTAS